MKKILLTTVALLTLSLTGCEQSYDDETGDYKLPPELKHCKVYELSSGVSSITTIVCPNLTTVTTNYSEGKTSETVWSVAP